VLHPLIITFGVHQKASKEDIQLQVAVSQIENKVETTAAIEETVKEIAIDLGS
jgi:hypothetical protein